MARESLVRDVAAAKAKIIALKNNPKLSSEERAKQIAVQEKSIVQFEGEIALIDKELDESDPANQH